MQIELTATEEELEKDTRKLNEIMHGLAAIIFPAITMDQVKESVLGALSSITGGDKHSYESPDKFGFGVCLRKLDHRVTITFYSIKKEPNIPDTKEQK